MRIVILVLCAVLAATVAGCTPKQRKWAGLAIGAAGHAADWRSTRWFAERDWPAGTYEANPVMGPAPSAAGVDVYFATTGLVLWAASQALPERWRPLAHVAVGVFGARLAIRNERARDMAIAATSTN